MFVCIYLSTYRSNLHEICTKSHENVMSLSSTDKTCCVLHIHNPMAVSDGKALKSLFCQHNLTAVSKYSDKYENQELKICNRSSISSTGQKATASAVSISILLVLVAFVFLIIKR